MILLIHLLLLTQLLLMTEHRAMMHHTRPGAAMMHKTKQGAQMQRMTWCGSNWLLCIARTRAATLHHPPVVHHKGIYLPKQPARRVGDCGGARLIIDAGPHFDIIDAGPHCDIGLRRLPAAAP